MYLDEASIQNPQETLVYLYSDVFAITKPEITITPPAAGLIQIATRVLTAATPVQLNLSPASDGGGQVYIYAPLLDQPLTVSTGSSQSENTELVLGPGSGKDGVLLTVTGKGEVSVKYLTEYAPVHDEDLQASLETQLRIALALFWRRTSLAVSLCSYVASVTNKSRLYPEVNGQAVALGRQLAAQAMMGPDVSYAPPLNVRAYRETVNTALNAVQDFEEQYNRFQDRTMDLDEQLKVWDVMIDHAETQRAIHMNATNTAWSKYQDAREVVARCKEHVRADGDTVQDARSDFVAGLAEWQAMHAMAALYDVCMALACK